MDFNNIRGLIQTYLVGIAGITQAVALCLEHEHPVGRISYGLGVHDVTVNVIPVGCNHGVVRGGRKVIGQCAAGLTAQTDITVGGDIDLRVLCSTIAERESDIDHSVGIIARCHT